MRWSRVFEGETAYRAYCDELGWLSTDGLTFPEWVDLSYQTQQLWHSAVARAGYEAFEEPDFED